MTINVPSTPLAQTRPVATALRNYFGELLEASTYRHFAYQLLSLPLALLYFTVLTVSFSLGLGLLLLLVGVFVLVGTLWLVLAFAELERGLGTALLGVNLSRRRRLRPDGLWDWARGALSDAGTYKAMLYLLLKLPYGLLVLLIGGSMVTLTAVLLASPFWYLFSPDQTRVLFQIGPHGYGLSVWSLLAAFAGGVAMLVLGVVLLNLLSRAWAFLSVALLTDYGESEQAQLEVQALRQGAMTIAPGGLNQGTGGTLAELLRQGLDATAAQGALLLQGSQVFATQGVTSELATAFQELRPSLPLQLKANQAHLYRNWQPWTATGSALAAQYGGMLVSLPVGKMDRATSADSNGAEAEPHTELHVFYPGRESPSRRELDFWGAVGNQAAVALEMARLLRQAHAQGSEQERIRLARDLHDSVAQALYGISLGTRAARAQLQRDPLKAAENLDYAVQLADGATSEMKALLFALRPDALEEGGLVAALAQQAEVLHLRYRLEAPLDAPQEPDLTVRQKGDLYRIAQEAAHNAVKHARASRVAISLQPEDGGWRLRVSDDGVGFERAASGSGSLGLKSMCERAAGLSAEIEITSRPGQGTTVSVFLPGTETVRVAPTPVSPPTASLNLNKEPS